MTRTKVGVLLPVCTIALPLFMLGGTFSHIFGLSLAVLAAFLILGVASGFSKGSLITLGCAILFFCVNGLPLAGIGAFFSALGVLCTVGILITFGKYWCLLTAPVGYGLALLIVSDPIRALGALIFLPPALVLGFMVKKGGKQSHIVIGTTACLAVSLAAVLFYTYGSLDSLMELIKTERELFVSEMSGMGISEDILRETANMTIGLLPAAMILATELIAYPAVRTVVGTAHRFGDPKPSPRTMVLRLETLSAIIFFAAVVLMLFADGIFMLVLGNLILLLSPAFCAVEIVNVIAQFRLGILRVSPLLILTLCFAGSLLPVLLAVMGAIHTVVANRAR